MRYKLGGQKKVNIIKQLQLKHLLIFFFIGWIIYSSLFGEHIQDGQGLGGDGSAYAAMTQQFPDNVFNHKLSVYSLHRILPGGLIYASLNFLHVSLSTSHILRAFEIYNSLLLILSVLFWQKISRQCNWNPKVGLISFAGLFFNYALLKNNGYYPVLTDTSGFFLSILLFYFYLTEKNYLVMLCGMIGAFVFPTLLYSAMILFIFPLQKISHCKKMNHMTSIIIGCMMSIILTGICLYVHFTQTQYTVGNYYVIPVIYLSGIALFSYIATTTATLGSRSHIFFQNISLPVFSRFILALLIIFGVSTLINSLSNGSDGSLTPFVFIGNLPAQALAYPFIFLVNHIIYYGPIICLLIYFWHDVVDYLTDRNIGLLVLISFCIAISIGSESRQFITFLPLWVILVAETLNTCQLTWKFTYSFIFLCLIASKFWLPINHGEWPTALTQEDFLKFPMQWYFMNFGPWVSHKMYLINLAIASFMLSLIYYLKPSVAFKKSS